LLVTSWHGGKKLSTEMVHLYRGWCVNAGRNLPRCSAAGVTSVSCDHWQPRAVLCSPGSLSRQLASTASADHLSRAGAAAPSLVPRAGGLGSGAALCQAVHVGRVVVDVGGLLVAAGGMEQGPAGRSAAGQVRISAQVCGQAGPDAAMCNQVPAIPTYHRLEWAQPASLPGPATAARRPSACRWSSTAEQCRQPLQRCQPSACPRCLPHNVSGCGVLGGLVVDDHVLGLQSREG